MEMTIYEAMQAYLADVGIVLRFEAFESSAVMPRIAAGESDMWMILARATVPIPEPTIAISHAHANAHVTPARISDPQYNHYFSLGRTSVDQAERIAAYRWVQEWLHNNYRHIPVMEVKNAFAFNSNLIADFSSNMVFNPNLTWLRLA